MNFEVQNALAALEKRTPDFFIVEALSEPNPQFRDTVCKILSALGSQPAVSPQLRDMLKLY